MATAPPIIVIYGDEEHRKTTALTAAVDKLLPPNIDRSLALTTYDGTRRADDGGPALNVVLEDLATLPFLADRRVVVIRDADDFVSTHRERLEKYLARPAPTGTLVLECRSFPRNLRLAKVAASIGELVECKKLFGPALVNFVLSEAQARGKQIERSAAARVVDLVGQETGGLAAEVEKLSLYVGERPIITDADVTALVGLTREEKIFAVMDAAAAGNGADALRLWRQVLATDPAATFKVLGGMAYKVRAWLAAQQMAAQGVRPGEIAPRVGMWGRERDLQVLLRRLTPPLLRRLLAAIAVLDSQAKSGTRSIETGVELLLVRLAGVAA